MTDSNDECKQNVRIYSDLIESLSWLFDVDKRTTPDIVNPNVALYVRSDKCELCQAQINDSLIESAVNVIVNKVGIQNIYVHIAESVYNSSSFKSLETKISFVKKHVCVCKLTEYHTLFKLLSRPAKESSDVSDGRAYFNLKHHVAITELVCPIIEAQSCHKLSSDATTLNILSDLLMQCSYSDSTIKQFVTAITANLGRDSYNEVVGILRKKCVENSCNMDLLKTLHTIDPFDDDELIDICSNIIKKHGSKWCIEKPNADTCRIVTWVVDKVKDKKRQLDLLKDLISYINEQTSGDYVHEVNWFVVDILEKYNSGQEIIDLIDHRTYAPTYFDMIHTFTECIPKAKTQDEFDLRAECCKKVIAYSRTYMEDPKPARYVRVICALVTRPEHSKFFLKRELCKMFTSFALTMMDENSLR
ncbi:hypothetical protein YASMINEVIRUS_1423 [Yasminevirus sp. GU-2018]|uniref:Uncharacterized protein n=1 Tax=Yasminevirus sp. GU-2018 TaxID=2420051 RepID=A0A5K0UB37_9VIRU|nr:hypothetical protein YASMINEVIRUS_1423 [Yasminevirus sp. GU-2018]